MSFIGKATYSAGPALPERAEDVSDLVGLVSPYETALLDHLGDPQRAATSTVHEWLEDQLLPMQGTIAAGAGLTNNTTATDIEVQTTTTFRPGDQLRAEGSREVMMVIFYEDGMLTVARGYGGTTPQGLSNGQTLHILGNAALEGDAANTPRFTNRVRKQNYSQIFSASIEVSGSQLAAKQAAVADEMEYQKQNRLRELLRDLENCVINGVASANTPQGSQALRRTMRGIIPSLTTNIEAAANAELTEDMLNAALRGVWESSSGNIDTLVVNGLQKRRINQFIAGSRSFDARSTRFRDVVSTYESDFGVCRVVLCRWVPADTLLMLDSSRIDVLPLASRSFQFKPMGATGDREAGMIVGEYTLELRNESAHGLIRGLSTAA